MKPPLLALVLALQLPVAAAQTGPVIDGDLWSIAGPPGERRWLVIHDRADGARAGVYHVEVIARKAGRPSWDVVRVRDHLALTAEALHRSVVKKLAQGRVYPERFDDAVARWRAAGGTEVCTSSVVTCLEGGVR